MAKKPTKKKVEEAKAPPSPNTEESKPHTLTSGRENAWKVTWGSRVKSGAKIDARSK